jgi:PAS domain S-box-containing protein
VLLIPESRNITEHKHAENALRESEAKFATAFQLNPLPTALMTMDSRYVEVNGAAKRHLGYSRAEMLGRTSVELGLHLDSQRRGTFYQLLQQHGRVREFEAVWLTKNGDRRTFLISAELLMLHGKRYLLAVNNDITARKQAEAERERLLAEFQQFRYIVSHDLNEPLRTMSNYVQLLTRRTKGKLDGSAEEYMAFVTDAAKRMQQMLTDLLAYTHAGQTLEFQAVDCEEMLAQMVSDLHNAITEQQATLTHDPPAHGPGRRHPTQTGLAEPHRQRAQVPRAGAAPGARLGTAGGWTLAVCRAGQRHRH